MRAGVMDIDIITDVNARQVAVNCKLVVVLAQTAGYILPRTVMWWYAPYIAGRMRFAAQASRPAYSL